MVPANSYSRSPLVEALLDFQVELPKDFVAKKLEECQEPVKVDYPSSSPLRHAYGRIELGDQVNASATSQDIGNRFVDASGLQIFQARVDGFTYNRLAPYLGWQKFSSEARRLWDVYRDVTKPVRLKRVAARYINRIDIPAPLVELKDYFRTGPEVSPALPQSMAAFFVQVTLPVEELKALVTLTETMAQPPRPGITSVVFDLDLFRTNELPTDEAGLWELIERFRDWKNKIFEACITDKIRELIK